MNQRMSRYQQRKQANKKKFWNTFLICFAVEIIIVAVIFGIWKFNNMFYTNIGGGMELEALSPISGNEPRNVIILGTDKSGLRSDVIMVMSVYPEKNTVSLMSVPRDTKVQINRSNRKINSALQIGGDELAVQTVKDLLSIPIHDYVVVNFDAVETIIDELGGIRFNVPCDMHYEDPEQDLFIHINKGEQLLNGEKAVQVLRFRQYPMADLQRNQVQQDFFKAAFSQKFQPQYIGKVPAIYGLITENVRSSMSANEVLGYLSVISDMNNRTVQTFELPVSIADPYVVIKRSEADALMDEYFR